MAPSVRTTVSAALSAVKRWRVLIALFGIYIYVFPYFASLRHANELPRVLTTMQIVDHGTFQLDSRIDEIGSRADISVTPEGHFYQNKAPGLSLLGVPVYLPVALACRVLGTEPSMAFVTWLLRLSIVIVPSILFLSYFREVSARFSSSAEAKNGALIAYALGSMALPYGLLFMSHAPAAAMVGVAFALSVRAVRSEAGMAKHQALAVGALLGLAMFTEYQAIFAALIVGVYALSGAKHRLHTAAMMLTTAAPFLIVLALYHIAAFGSPFVTGYAYSADPTNRIGFMGIVGFSTENLVQLFASPSNGLLLLSPWVVLSIVGAVAIANNRQARQRVGVEAAVAVTVVLVYCAFVVALAPHFARAGWTVGPRYIAIAMPFFAWLAAAGLETCLKHEAAAVPAYALLLVGVVVHVVAASTFPHWPRDYDNPLYEVSFRLLEEDHAPQSLGRWLGIPGSSSLAPLYVAVGIVLLRLLSPTKEYLRELLLGSVLAVFVVIRYEHLAVTQDEALVERGWTFITRLVDE
jgi:hypothetical protein